MCCGCTVQFYEEDYYNYFKRVNTVNCYVLRDDFVLYIMYTNKIASAYLKDE